MIFVDTSAWFSLMVPWDANHAKAVAWFQQNDEPLVTTDYVIDETLTLMRSRGEQDRAFGLGLDLYGQTLAALHYLDRGEITAGWRVFRGFDDKEWSLTDCTSKALIEKLNIAKAFTFDHHFRQFGTVEVVP